MNIFVFVLIVLYPVHADLGNFIYRNRNKNMTGLCETCCPGRNVSCRVQIRTNISALSMYVKKFQRYCFCDQDCVILKDCCSNYYDKCLIGSKCIYDDWSNWSMCKPHCKPVGTQRRWHKASNLDRNYINGCKLEYEHRECKPTCHRKRRKTNLHNYEAVIIPAIYSLARTNGSLNKFVGINQNLHQYYSPSNYQNYTRYYIYRITPSILNCKKKNEVNPLISKHIWCVVCEWPVMDHSNCRSSDAHVWHVYNSTCKGKWNLMSTKLIKKTQPTEFYFKEYSKSKLDEINKFKSNAKKPKYSDYIDEIEKEEGPDLEEFTKHKRIRQMDKETEYQSRRRSRKLSPTRHDPFAMDAVTPDVTSERRTYADVMNDSKLIEESKEIQKKIIEKVKEGKLESKVKSDKRKEKHLSGQRTRIIIDSREKWEDTPKQYDTPSKAFEPSTPGSISDAVTPMNVSMASTPNTVNRTWDATPGVSDTPKSSRKNRWDQTPRIDRDTPDMSWGETPRAGTSVRDTPKSSGRTPSRTPDSKRRSRWDQTPIGAHTPSTPSTPGFTPSGPTPAGSRAMGLRTPATERRVVMTPDMMQNYALQNEIDEKNRYLTDADLDTIFPSGFRIIQPPVNYIPIRTPNRKLMATPTPIAGTPAGFRIQTPDQKRHIIDMQPPGENMPMLKPDDLQYFDSLLVDVDEDSLTHEEKRDRKIMQLLVKIKNGTPQMRKSAMRHITENARAYGAAALFNIILPLLMSPTLEEQESHLMVKVIDRILYKLDDLVRPYVHKILVVIEPLLIDEDYYARVEGREIISNLAKAAGLATMISTMRPDIDNNDEYVRNTTARAFAVVSSALGIPNMLPFLKAVCKSQKSWQARHTGIKIVQQVAILVGCAILPYLKSLVEIIEHGLVDTQQKVRTITALALAGLAEASSPYGIESFDTVLKPLWKGIRLHSGKGLAAFLKAIGYLIPLMDAEYANYYTREVMVILVREFQSPDEEMKKIVLKVVKQCCSTDGVEADYIRNDIMPPFFKSFWNQRMSLDKRNYKQLVETTVEIGGKVGSADIIDRIVNDLKDENEHYRKMIIETIDCLMTEMGSDHIDARLEEQLIDGILYAFQEQNADDDGVLDGFGAIVNSLGIRVKPYLPQICATILWRLNNKSAKVRQQAADLISRIANVIKVCQEEKLMGHLGVVLYEYLGEEYPEVLGSILSGLRAIVSVIGMTKMSPPIKDLLPRLTPILKNRHEKVQENCIDLVGRIADRGSEFVPAREWMRICFELLELLKAHKKSIRRATVNTFGYIAKAIGPHDVLATLLNNLKVQERQNRVCTTVAIAIVSETCAPFTVLPALLNEYRVHEMNVQNGVLKSLSFMFEYIGEMAKDYIYAIVPLLEDALMERDLVHRQTAMSSIGHLALGVYGFNCEDALIHLLNYVWPNIYEVSPHVVQAFMLSIEGFRLGIGPQILMQYCIQGLFHPARKVRDVHWRVYNNIYIGSQDALTAHYPRINNDGKNTYIRYELDYIL
ncbi:nuclear protein [Intoshia linei]|uniref:Nuclear protein n=1 Tax=Intoshia linei TaxID=1819745 RepID=A0A177B6X9_9BILA|nr:nuclear protein [Intoshia linei]